MTARQRILVAAIACAVHLALFVPTIGPGSYILERDFGPQAEEFEDGALPYRDQRFEYPPLAIPVIVGPAYVTEGVDAYGEAFQWEMLGVDLAIVLVLALALPGRPREIIAALAVYTAGMVALSELVLDDSPGGDGPPLALARFDLVPALLILGAVLARGAARSATWSALLSTATMVKGFPVALYPALLRGERRLRRVLMGTLAPLALALTLVLALGDSPLSAIDRHTERGLQAETVAATPFEIAGLLGAGASSGPGPASYDVVADGTGVARWTSILIGLGLYLLVLWAGWRAPVRSLNWAVALVAIMVVFAPVLSPQFLLWLLPLSAAAYGLRWENVALVCAFVLTQLALHSYDQVISGELGPEFVWPIAARNAVLLVYLWLVCAPIIRAPRQPDRDLALGRWTASSS